MEIYVAEKNETIVERSKALSPEHLGKCLTCKSFVKLGFCLCVSVSLSLSLSLSVSLSLCLCAHMDESQCMRLLLGTTEWNHSHFTGNSLLQHLQAGATSLMQMSASARESHGAAPSSSVSCPQVTLSATSPQVQMGPTRTITSDLLSATLAEAATQLSFAAFLERCISVNASPPPQVPVLTAPHRHNLLTLLHLAVPAAPAMPATVTCTLRPHMSYHSHHRVSRTMPVNMPHMVHLSKRHRCDLVCVHPSQSRPHSHMSVPPKWEHILCAQQLPTREVQVPPKREPTILLVQILVQELVLFLNHEPWFFLWSNLVNPNLTGSVTSIQLTAISCIINTVSLFSRTGPQELHQYYCGGLWKVPCGYSSRCQ